MSGHSFQIADLALQRSRYKHLSDDEWRWFLQQVEGKERTADKLPSFAAIENWWYPVRLSCEQCSSEITAKYKASLLTANSSSHSAFADLTGGYGVDTFFLSGHFTHTDYVEQDAELCRIAAHNFSLQPSDIAVHNTTAETFLATAGQYDLIFADPYRRDSHGGKVFRLADCTPDLVQLLPAIMEHLNPDGLILLKLSPMLDISQALKELSVVRDPASLVRWNVHVVAVKNEVKEVLFIGTKGQDTGNPETITAIDLAEPENAFVFIRDEEHEAVCRMVSRTSSHPTFLYEPNAAVLKSGAYKLVAQRFGLQKLDVNTHLYVSDTLVEHFPGRVWKIIHDSSPLSQANIICRNYPLTPEQLKKKMRVRDGGNTYLIACRVAQKTTVFVAERV